ncbi:MAG: helix-turn-helix transcriptional regulator [Mucilaginibacter sp.]|uniref:helix-turn-helix transcriptional regulator n=1 Tax=Mucilaginibacter sp. TaxID=1882438 RepID=UPI0032651316
MKVTRRKAGYQQQHVARLLVDVNVSTLSLWENEWYMPSGTSLIKLCILYGKTPQELYPEYFDLIKQSLIERQEYPDGDTSVNRI